MNKIAIITGSSGTLGKELINEYLKNDYFVIGIYNTHKLKISNSNLIQMKYNLENEKEFINLKELLLNEVNNKTQIVIVHAAGIIKRENILDYDEELFFKFLRVNSLSFINLYKSIFNILKKSKITNILLISTNLLKRCNKNNIYYILSKGMLDNLVKIIAYENSKYNILTNSILLGMFISNMNKNMDKEKIKAIENNIPIKRIATKKEIAKFISNFTNTNTFITGENIIMDGGNTIGY